MMNNHLELGPVECCAVWKGGLFPVISGMRHFGGDVSGMAVDVKLFHEAGCRLVHKYRIYGDPFHTRLRAPAAPQIC